MVMLKLLLESDTDTCFKVLNFRWFQQDGATFHTARATLELVREIFRDRIISRNLDSRYPARSPDWTALDCFLWSYFNKSRILNQLKKNIRQEKRFLNEQILEPVMQKVLRRARPYEAATGGI